MDWHDIHDVLAKVREEMDEVEGALASNDLEAAAGELGDMLLALANAPRFIGHNAEETLRRACGKFIERIRHGRADRRGGRTRSEADAAGRNRRFVESGEDQAGAEVISEGPLRNCRGCM